MAQAPLFWEHGRGRLLVKRHLDTDDLRAVAVLGVQLD